MRWQSSIAKRRTRLVTLGGILAALAIIIGYVETVLMPDIAVPGVKLGISNVAVVTAMYLCGPVYGLAVAVIKASVTGMLFSGPMAAVFSISGALLSYAVMLAVRSTKKFGLTGVSSAGGVFHNVGQVIAAAVFAKNASVFIYLPVLFITGAIAGFLSGLVTEAIVKSCGNGKSSESGASDR